MFTFTGKGVKSIAIHEVTGETMLDLIDMARVIDIV
jgi:hypothetical protein